MPGIFGAISADAEEVQRTLALMKPRLVHRSWYKTSLLTADGCGLGCISLVDGMEVAQEEGVCLAFYGHVVDLQPLRKRLAEAGAADPPVASIPQLLLRTFLQFGLKPLQGLNGYYAVAIWETAQQRFNIVVDRGAVVKVHYWQQDGVFVFAPEAKAISCLPRFNRIPDDHGVYDLLSLTYLLEDRTLFRDIRQMLPATTLTFENGTVNTSRYWEHTTRAVEPENAPLETYADGYYDRLREAVRKRLPDHGLGIFLTGGLDSRVLAGLVRDCGYPGEVHALTCGDPAGHDYKFAPRIARLCGIKHHPVWIGEDYLYRYAEETVSRMEGQTTLHVCWALSTDDLAEHNGLLYMLNGYLGCGNISGDFPDDQNPDRAFQLLLERAFAGLLSENRLNGLLKPRLAQFKGQTLRQLRAQYDSMTQYEPAARVEIIRRDDQHRKFIGLDMELEGVLSFLLFPYDDNDVWDYLLGIPMPYRRGKAFFLDLIKRRLPRLAAVPRSGTGVPVGGSELMRYWYRGQQRIYHHELPRLTRGRFGGRNLEKGVFYADWQRGASRPYIEEQVAKTELYEDFFEVDAVRRHVQDHLDGRLTDITLVHTLLSFILWREQFCR